MRSRFIALALVTTFTVGCQTAYQGDENSPYYIVPTGTQLTLHKPLAFDPGQLGVYVQNGRVMSIRDVQHYDPFCKFELQNQSDAARTVPPTSAVVTRALQYRQDGTYSRLEGVRLAALSLGVMAQAGGGEPDGGPPVWSFITSMNLRSVEQPEIFRITCLRWAYPGMAEHVTIEEIRRTLDPLFTLRLPAQG